MEGEGLGAFYHMNDVNVYVGKPSFPPTVPPAWSCTHLPGSWRVAPGRSPVYLKGKRGRQVGFFREGGVHVQLHEIVLCGWLLHTLKHLGMWLKTSLSSIRSIHVKTNGHYIKSLMDGQMDGWMVMV